MNQEGPMESDIEEYSDEERHEQEEILDMLNEDNSHLFDYALEKNENRESYDNQAHLRDYGTNWFPICGVGAVCFPEQQVPMKFNDDEQELYDRLVGSARANGFVVLFPLDIEECHVLPYIATLSKVVQANPQTLGMELVGVHRCKVLEHNLERGEALVQLLPEVVVSSKLSSHIPKYARNFSIYEKRNLAYQITGYPFNFLRDVTENHMNECCVELEAMIPRQAVRNARDKGLVYFSYFAARNIFATRKTEYSLLKEDSANTRIAAALKYCKVSIAKCSTCNAPIFRKDHIMRLPHQAMTHVNAHGFVHKINLVQHVTNYNRVSLPSFEFTWFPDYAWIIIQCSQCDHHIGWEYISMTRNPAQFFGIQREGIRFENDENENLISVSDNSDGEEDEQSV